MVVALRLASSKHDDSQLCFIVFKDKAQVSKLRFEHPVSLPPFRTQTVMTISRIFDMIYVISGQRSTKFGRKPAVDFPFDGFGATGEG